MAIPDTGCDVWRQVAGELVTRSAGGCFQPAVFRYRYPMLRRVVAGSAAWIIGGESGGKLVSSVQMLRPARAFGTAGTPGAGSPYFGGRVLVADRGNNRLLLMDAGMQVI